MSQSSKRLKGLIEAIKEEQKLEYISKKEPSLFVQYINKDFSEQLTKKIINSMDIPSNFEKENSMVYFLSFYDMNTRKDRKYTVHLKNVYKGKVFDDVHNQMTDIKFLLNIFYKDAADIDYKSISYEDIIDLIKNNYMTEDLNLDLEKIKDKSEDEKKSIIHKLTSFWSMLAAIVTVLAILDSPTAQSIIEQIPIVGQAYTILMEQQSLVINGHINKKTNLFTYSSLSSKIIDVLDYGTPFEVKEFHNGWLKIKFKNSIGDIEEGWIQEDNAIWSFTKN